MWEINNSFQALSFLYSLAFGFGYCLFYDAFRVLRKLNSFSAWAVFLQDIIYFIIISFTTFLLLMAFSNGEIRGYVILGIAIGFLICYLTISRFWVKFLFFFSSLFKGFFKKVIEQLNCFFEYIFKKIKKAAKYCIKLSDKCKKIFKKDLKNVP